MKTLTVALAIFLSACARPVARDPYARGVLYPVVRVDTGRATGTGIVVWTDGEVSRVLTCHHVVIASATITVDVFDWSGEEIVGFTTVPARVVACESDLDLAVLEIPASKLAIADWRTEVQLKLREEARVAGCRVGEPPTAVPGEVIQVGFDPKTSAPVVIGNSGGGVFVRRPHGWVMVGVARAVWSSPNVGVFESVNYFVPMESARQFVSDSCGGR